MIYKNFKGLQLPALGLGTMRFPMLPEDKGVDEAATAEMVDYALKHGVNYFDTAWFYHNGESENIVGRILSQYPRESFFLADKFPGLDAANLEKKEEIFEKQLEKCRTSYFDFYLFHNVSNSNVDAYLDPKYGLLEYLLEQKKQGRIKHLGFSTHADNVNVKRFLDAYGEHMEFCQVQLNYLDWHLQSAKEKMEIVMAAGIPVWVMEPLRGGKLAALDAEYMQRLQALRPDESAPGWGFRFLQSLPAVVVTLSGMSNMAQLKENIEIFNEEKPLNEVEKKAVLGIADDMMRKNVLTCTACRYCVEKCPKGLDIPYLLELFNTHSFGENGFAAPAALAELPREKWPHACISCKQCEKVCPQGIKISQGMAYFAAKLDG